MRKFDHVDQVDGLCLDRYFAGKRFDRELLRISLEQACGVLFFVNTQVLALLIVDYEATFPCVLLTRDVYNGAILDILNLLDEFDVLLGNVPIVILHFSLLIEAVPGLNQLSLRDVELKPYVLCHDGESPSKGLFGKDLSFLA